MVEVLEHGISSTAVGATPGSFPQVAGISFTFDPTLPARQSDDTGVETTPGQRVIQVTVGDDIVVMNGELQGDPNRTFNMVTLNFLADGGDDYPFLNFANANRMDLDGASFAGNDPNTGTVQYRTGGEQDALGEFLQTFHTATSPFNIEETPISRDTRIVQINPVN